MKILIDLFFITIIIIALDNIYMYINKSKYERQIIRVQKTSLQIKYLGVILCYILLVLGLYYFIIRTHRPISDAFLLGILIFGIYNTTNYAIIKNWDFQIVIQDSLWGGILLTFTTFLMYNIKILQLIRMPLY